MKGGALATLALGCLARDLLHAVTVPLLRVSLSPQTTKLSAWI